MACATVYSYTSAGECSASIPYGNVVADRMVRTGANQDSGRAIVCRGYASNRNAVALQREDARATETLNDAGAMNRDVGLAA